MAKAVSDPFDRAENERQLFAGWRAVREHYDMAPGGVVIGKEGIKRWHAPIAHPELPQMVAKLEHADDAAVLAFYETYGSLGYLDECDDPAQHFYTWPDGTRTMSGDPIDWVRAHARTVRVCFELTDAIQRNDKAALERLTTDRAKGYAARGEIGRESAPDLLKRALLLFSDEDGRRVEKASLLTRAKIVRAKIINPNIAGIHRFLKVKADGTEQSYFSFSGQIVVVYWHLANLADGGIVGRCKRPGCGAFFIQRHKSQEYCAPRYAQRESPCALWVRQRRLGQPKPTKRTSKKK